MTRTPLQVPQRRHRRSRAYFLPKVVTSAGLCSGTIALTAGGSFTMGLLVAVLAAATVVIAAVLLRP